MYYTCTFAFRHILRETKSLVYVICCDIVAQSSTTPDKHKPTL